jgi:hypothetical protein
MVKRREMAAPGRLRVAVLAFEFTAAITTLVLVWATYGVNTFFTEEAWGSSGNSQVDSPR